VQRLQKTLEDANLKLASVLTDIMGLSGRTILEASIAAETDPDRLLALVHPRVKAEPARLRAALTGRVTDRHRFLLRLHLGQYDALAAALAEVDAEVERDLDPFRDAVRLLRTIPGIGDLAARAIVAEIGTDMGRFPTAAHLVSWAGLWPHSGPRAVVLGLPGAPLSDFCVAGRDDTLVQQAGEFLSLLRCRAFAQVECQEAQAEHRQLRPRRFEPQEVRGAIPVLHGEVVPNGVRLGGVRHASLLQRRCRG
jgi:hypothetical protein